MSKSLGVVICLLPLVGAWPNRADATGLNQTWVSDVGKDTNTCTIAAPCATFAGAIAKTEAAGAIGCLTSGQYGPFTVNKSLKIVCDGVEAGVSTPSGTAITIAAGATDAIYISGLDIQGLRTATTGIRITKAGALGFHNMIVEGFTGQGVYVLPTSTTGGGVFENCHFVNNGYGLFVDSTNADGKLTGVVLEDTEDSGNTTGGVKVISPNSPTGVDIDTSRLVANPIGVTISGAFGVVRLRNSFIAGNGVGLSATNNAAITSSGTNQITDNGTGTTPTMIGTQ